MGIPMVQVQEVPNSVPTQFLIIFSGSASLERSWTDDWVPRYQIIILTDGLSNAIVTLELRALPLLRPLPLARNSACARREGRGIGLGEQRSQGLLPGLERMMSCQDQGSSLVVAVVCDRRPCCLARGARITAAREVWRYTQYEGESHDVDENKRYEKWDVGISHDIHENKRLISLIPRYQ
jgi:hypothetical protein